MPINYLRYHPDWKDIIRPKILKRDGYKCKKCGVVNRSLVIKQPDNTLLAVDDHIKQWATRKDVKIMRVILTIAHLNHLVIDNRDQNLAALCQWCHLDHDKEHKKLMKKVRKVYSADQMIKLLSEPGGENLLPHAFSVLRGLRNQLAQMIKIKESRPENLYVSKYDQNIRDRVSQLEGEYFNLMKVCCDLLATHYDHPDPLDFYVRYSESDRKVFDSSGVSMAVIQSEDGKKDF